jgi:hypothetical protein
VDTMKGAQLADIVVPWLHRWVTQSARQSDEGAAALCPVTSTVAARLAGVTPNRCGDKVLLSLLGRGSRLLKKSSSAELNVVGMAESYAAKVLRLPVGEAIAHLRRWVR